jgi:sulfur-oxidizing protein SoxX
MRKGEKVIIGGLAVLGIAMMSFRAWQIASETEEDPGVPFYTTADVELTNKASLLIKRHNCKDCHSLWATRDMTQNVPAPRLDGIGTLKTEQWLYDYFSAENPQTIVPSRLKPRYRMPSFAKLSETDRRILTKYMSSLKVEDWYLDEAKSHEYEKLTGKDYVPNANN